jgi:pimeloyl-ACP methyl ester carboxylesterase
MTLRSRRARLSGVDRAWEIVTAGPERAEKTVLLLPGGMISARSYAELMAEPALARTRLLAVTLPGNAGTPPLEDFSIEASAHALAEFASRSGVDVVVGFSNGATVAHEMVVSGGFAGPVVLLGISLSARDESAFFRGMIRLCSVLGTLPIAFLKKAAGSLIPRASVAPERRDELKADFARNNAGDLRRALREYLRWLHRDDDPARRLCEAGVPPWVVHAEKAGDGGLTPRERAVLEACSHVRVVTLPGKVFFIPNEAPDRVAELIVDALGMSGGGAEI